MTSQEELCYLCYLEETNEQRFVLPLPCDCKGSLKLHKSCLKELMKNTMKCDICNQSWWKLTGVHRMEHDRGIGEEITLVKSKRHGS